MIANYHTHTWRCNHAFDTEREYVEAAVARGMKTLGFADHAPYFFDEGHVSNLRMTLEEYPNYVAQLLQLREEYAGKIDILIGLEMEYYPKYFEKTLEYCLTHGLDYIIMGQHCLDHTESWQAHMPAQDEALVACYVDRVLEGAATGAYTYIAHPDHFKFAGDERIWRRHMERMCTGLKEMNVPVEMNLLGFAESRHYPRRDFFEIVKSVGNTVVMGCDAHSKAQMGNVDAAKRAKAWLSDIGITPVESLQVVKPTLIR